MWFRHPLLVLTWPLPNFENPIRRAPYIYAINSFFFALATTAIALRLYTRIVLRKWFGPDDVFIVFSWFCALCTLATVFFAYSHYGWDIHTWDLPKDDFTPALKSLMVSKIFWSTTSAGIRMSVMFLYYRLLNHIGLRKYRWVLHITTFFVIAIWLCWIFTSIFACTPIWSYWVWPTTSYCIDEGLVDTILSVLNTASEASVAALPIPIILWLDLTRAKRWSVACLLCLGFAVVIIGSVRSWIVWQTFNTDDMTWWAAPQWITSEVEVYTAMICACAPALRPLLGRIFKKRQVIINTITMRRSFSRASQTGSVSISAEDLGQGPYSTYSTYWKEIDVEGIGVDGFGYTVTITAERSKTLEQRPSRLRRLFHSEKDLENNDNVPSEPSPKSLVTDVFDWIHYLGINCFHRPIQRENRPIEITAVRSLDVVEEPAADNPTSRTSSLTQPASARLSSTHSRKLSSVIQPPIIQPPQMTERSTSPSVQTAVAARVISPRVRARMVERRMSPVLSPNNASITPVNRAYLPSTRIVSARQPPLVNRSMSPEMQSYPDMSMWPSFLSQMTASNVTPVIQAPVASRRISPELFRPELFSSSPMEPKAEPETFYEDSEEGSAIDN